MFILTFTSLILNFFSRAFDTFIIKCSKVCELEFCINSFKYLVIEDIGVILFDSLSNAGEEMLEAQSKINLKIPINNEINYLSDNDCNELTNWDAEIYRINLNITFEIIFKQA